MLRKKEEEGIGSECMIGRKEASKQPLLAVCNVLRASLRSVDDDDVDGAKCRVFSSRPNAYYWQ